MSQYIDARSLGLPAKTVVEEIDRHTLALVLKRKSRIIMSDGTKIVAKVEMIKSKKPKVKVLLITNAPICSKTLQLFEIKGLTVKNI